jgi:hypothetical protein
MEAKTTLLKPIQNKINSVHFFKSYFLTTILILFSHIHLSPKRFLPSTFFGRNFVFISYLISCATCPTHIIFLYLISPLEFSSNTSFKDHYVLFSILLILSPSQTQILFWALCNRKTKKNTAANIRSRSQIFRICDIFFLVVTDHEQFIVSTY